MIHHATATEIWEAFLRGYYAGDGLKQEPVEVGSTDRDRVIKPSAQIRHPSGQQPLAGNASNVHPVNPRAHGLHCG